MILRDPPSLEGHRMVFHIGTHKTATTTVQEGLAASRPTLGAAGITYPRAATRWDGHHPLAWALGVPHPDADPTLTPEQLTGAIRQEHAASGGDAVLLSSEDFCFLEDPSVLPSSFPEFRISVVVYLRRQDSLLLADHNQNVRMHRRRFDGDVADFIAAFGLDKSSRFDYDALLAPWEECFGPEALHVRPFETAVRRGIIDDLLETADLGRVRLPDERARASNRSLDPLCTRVLRHLNLIELEQTTHRGIVTTLERATEEGVLTSRFGVGLTREDAAAVADFTRALRASNEAVIERYPALGDELSLGGIDYDGQDRDVLDDVPLEALQQQLLAWSLPTA